MASEWPQITLGDFVSLQRGHDLTESERRAGRVPVMGSAGQNGFHDTARAKGPGIVIGRSGASFGKVHYTESDYWPHNTALYVTDFKGNDPRFAFYFLSSINFDRFNSGSAQPSLNRNFIYPIPVRIPPLPEQKAIARILGTLDDKIELNRRMNATLEAMARALFQSWFIDFDPVRRNAARAQNQPSTRPKGHPSPSGRRAGDAGDEDIPPLTLGEGWGEGLVNLDKLFPESFQDSELGEIPEGWTAGTLGDVATNPRRSVQPNEIAPNTPYIALEHMPRRSIALGDWEPSAEVESGKTAFQKGEILFGKLRPYFHKVGVAPVSGVCSTDILVLSPSKPEWFGFLLGHTSSDAAIQFVDKHSTGTKMPRTNWRDLSSYKIAIPSPAIAKAFNDQIQLLVARIQSNLHQSRTLATLRDTLLPKLLSGELSPARLPN